MTVLIECVSAYIIGIRKKNDIVYVGLVNVLTNPLVVVSVFIIGLRFGHNTSVIYEYIIEVCVVIAEGIIYKKVLDYKKIHPLLISLILNAVSYFSGEIYYFILNRF